MKKWILLLLLLLLLLLPLAGEGATVWIVFDNTLRAESAVASQLKKRLGPDAVLYPLEAGVPPAAGGAQGRIVIVLGQAALEAGIPLGENDRLIASYLPFADFIAKYPTGVQRYYLHSDQPLERLIALARLLFPSAPLVVPTVAGKREGSRYEEAMGEGAVEYLRFAETSASADVVSALLDRQAIPVISADSGVISRKSLKPLLLGAYYRKKPLVVYDRDIVRAGATVGVYTSTEDAVENILALLQRLERGQAVARIVGPERFSVSVNFQIARAIGLSIGAEDELEQRLREQEQGRED